MAILALNRSQAFQSGCGMWIIPRFQGGIISKKIDWYLNFQLSRSRARHREDPSPQLKLITKENNIPDLAPPPDQSSPLMISAQRGLPTHALVDLDNSISSEIWCKQAHEIWRKMGSPSLRIFLPSGLTVENFKSLWPGDKRDEVQVVAG